MKKCNDETINPRLKSILDEIKTVPPRDLRRVAQGRALFLAQAARTRQELSRYPDLNLAGWLGRTWKGYSTASITLAIIIILGIMVAGGGTVYAAQDSLPNEVLYPIKILSEDVRVELAPSQQAELDLLLEFSQRRGEEIVALVSLQITPNENVQTRFEQQIQQALQIAGNMDDTGTVESLTRIHETMTIQLKEIEYLRAKTEGKTALLLTDLQDWIKNRLLLVENGMADPEGFRQKFKNELQNGNIWVTPGSTQSGQYPGGWNTPEPQATPTSTEPQPTMHGAQPTPQGPGPQPSPQEPKSTPHGPKPTPHGPKPTPKKSGPH